MLSPNYPVLCFPLPYRVAPVFVQVVSPSLGWSPLSSFLVIWSPTGDTRGPSVVFEAVDMPCPGPFHFSYSVDYIYDSSKVTILVETLLHNIDRETHNLCWQSDSGDIEHMNISVVIYLSKYITCSEAEL